ncbi:hypothetical protein BBP40_001038 [Aspergillus hancockii]|nr:hypothetical protein BBP40_001038 [Aspergillus hancockii]
MSLTLGWDMSAKTAGAGQCALIHIIIGVAATPAGQRSNSGMTTIPHREGPGHTVLKAQLMWWHRL